MALLGGAKAQLAPRRTGPGNGADSLILPISTHRPSGRFMGAKPAYDLQIYRRLFIKQACVRRVRGKAVTVDDWE